MRSHFYPPPPERPNAVTFVQTATVVLDTNALLEPYRYSVTARDAALDALEAVRGRLWMPHQVGLEFFRHHEDKRAELSQAYENALLILDKARKDVRAAFGEKRNFQESRNAVGSKLDRSITRLKRNIKDLREEDAAVVAEEDPVLDRLTELFDGRLASKPNPTEIRRQVNEFHDWRVPNQIPPGFEDVPRKGRTIRAAGDYLIWEEVLAYASEIGTDVLLVTNDSKKDWWEHPDGNRSMPRRELIEEFAERTGHAYHQMKLLEFIRAVEDAYGVNVDDEVVDEITAIETHDRSLGTIHRLLLDASRIPEAQWDLRDASGLSELQKAMRDASGLSELQKAMRDASGLSELQEALRDAGRASDLRRFWHEAGGASAAGGALQDAERPVGEEVLKDPGTGTLDHQDDDGTRPDQEP